MASRIYVLTAAVALATLTSSAAGGSDDAGIASLSPFVIPEAEREAARRAVREGLRKRITAANLRSTLEWRKVKGKADWEAFRDRRLAALRKSLGTFPEPPKNLHMRETRTIEGDGFVIRNLIFRSRPGVHVTANLYLPAKPPESMPGILICHSHHRPKSHGELQDMGMTWARGGCAVLVLDQLGHGERGQHPFRSSEDYAKPYAVSRQDYYFRFDNGIQLHLVGESLIGWMAWDMMRGVDLLLGHKGVDPKRIILLGSVAGGGDPAAVTAALDRRIAAAVPFNFGGPQPENRFPLPKDAELRFNYAGGGSWESTRNLRRGAADGFLPWMIVGSLAPRGLIYAHEFAWDRDNDPVWRRFQSIYRWYDAADRLSAAKGRGSVRGRAPEATHCTHIGKVHRAQIHPAFKRWFDIPVTAKDEYSKRLSSDQLKCLNDSVRRELSPFHNVLRKLADERLAAARKRRAGLSVKKQRDALRADLATVLADIKPSQTITAEKSAVEDRKTYDVVRHQLHVADGVRIPIIELTPKPRDRRRPAVICVAQSGKAGFLKHRSAEIQKLLAADVAVYLVDVRGTGELAPGSDRGRYSAATGRSSTELMLGGTTVGGRLRDLRMVVRWVRSQNVDPKRIALWGESFAKPNPTDTKFKVPRRVDDRPRDCEPLGGLLVMLTALYEDDIAAVYIHGGLNRFRSVLDYWQTFIPHDTVIPGLLTVGDLPDLTAAIAPTSVCLSGTVDGLNRRMRVDDVRRTYTNVDSAAARLSIVDEAAAARWLLKAVRP